MATAAIELDQDAFMELVTENHLQVEGPTKDHWLYTGRRGKDGWELYKTKSQPRGWLYQARRVATLGVGGGTVQLNISIPSGTTARLIAGYCTSVASNVTLNVLLYDEDGANAMSLGSLAAGVSNNCTLPTVGTAITATGNRGTSENLLLGPGQTLVFLSGNGLQNETMTIYLALLMATEVQPTWATTGSAATVTLAASTISAANTLQAVYI